MYSIKTLLDAYCILSCKAIILLWMKIIVVSCVYTVGIMLSSSGVKVGCSCCGSSAFFFIDGSILPLGGRLLLLPID